MKRNKLSRYATAVAIASLAGIMSACGSSSGSSVAGIAGIGGVGGTASNSGGCVALTTTMSFSATNAYIDSANIYAVPSGTASTAGTMETYVSAGGAVSTTTGNGVYSNTWNSNVSDAYVSMTVANYNTGYSTGGYGYGTIPSPTIGTGYPYGSSGTSAYESLTGSLQFTATRWENLIYEFQSQYGYGGTGYTGVGTIPTVGSNTIPNVCVSGVAMSVGHYNNLLYGGAILLFLNNNPSSYIDIVL
jgi:hypothetical protein